MSNLIGIDYDGVIVPFGPLTDLDQPPIIGVIEAINSLKSKGYTIVIHTSRLSQYWWNYDYKNFGASSPTAFGAAQFEYVKNYLSKWKIPYDILTAEKMPCLVYFDDRAVRISEDYGLLEAVSEFVPLPWRAS